MTNTPKRLIVKDADLEDGLPIEVRIAHATPSGPVNREFIINGILEQIQQQIHEKITSLTRDPENINRESQKNISNILRRLFNDDQFLRGNLEPYRQDDRDLFYSFKLLYPGDKSSTREKNWLTLIKIAELIYEEWKKLKDFSKSQV